MHDLLQQVARQRTALLMGIVNVTPNSFFDGGRYEEPEAARSRVDALLRAGADILDIGAESTKPGAPAIAASEQIARVGSALAWAVERGALVSIDTASPEVADYALGHGAGIVNDVTCLGTPELADVVARHSAALVISHSRAPQSEMQGFSQWPDDAYADVVAEVLAELEQARSLALARGVRDDDVLFDPGIGFSKNARHSLTLLARMPELVAHGVPLVIGTGRKSFIASLDGSRPEERLGGTIASSLFAARHGAQILRVHDVAELRQALLVARALSAHCPPGAAC
ncbi:MAG: dihydropteroate synthase [Polyangiaceae bacterium]